jgi:hypothetical protein
LPLVRHTVYQPVLQGDKNLVQRFNHLRPCNKMEKPSSVELGQSLIMARVCPARKRLAM